MSATKTTFSYGTQSPVEDATPNSPTELMAMLNNLLSQLNDFNSTVPTTGHTHNGTDSSYISSLNGESVSGKQSTGSPFVAGTLVYVTSYSDPDYIVAKAQAKDPSNTSLYAQFVCVNALTSGTAATVFKRGRVTGLNTSGGTVGRPAWLDTTSGQWTVTCPQPSGCQVVGTVEVVHASSGVINFDIKGPVPQSSAHEV